MATEEPVVPTETEVPAADATATVNPAVETEAKETKEKKTKKAASAPKKPRKPAQHPPYFEVIELFDSDLSLPVVFIE